MTAPARVELPGGGWADLRDPDAVTERQRKPFLAASGRLVKSDDMEDSGFIAVLDVQDALVLALVNAWSYEAPVTADSLLDLPCKALDALRAACFAHRDALTPDFGPTPDPASPTEPSSV